MTIHFASSYPTSIADNKLDGSLTGIEDLQVLTFVGDEPATSVSIAGSTLPWTLGTSFLALQVWNLQIVHFLI